jgi:hypothetical protein
LQSYVYNDIGRLTNATGSYGSLGNDYDRVGNRTRKTADTVEEPYAYKPGTNQLSQSGPAVPMFTYLSAYSTKTGNMNMNYI